MGNLPHTTYVVCKNILFLLHLSQHAVTAIWGFEEDKMEITCWILLFWASLTHALTFFWFITKLKTSISAPYTFFFPPLRGGFYLSLQDLVTNLWVVFGALTPLCGCYHWMGHFAHSLSPLDGYLSECCIQNEVHIFQFSFFMPLPKGMGKENITTFPSFLSFFHVEFWQNCGPFSFAVFSFSFFWSVVSFSWPTGIKCGHWCF